MKLSTKIKRVKELEAVAEAAVRHVEYGHAKGCSCQPHCECGLKKKLRAAGYLKEDKASWLETSGGEINE